MDGKERLALASQQHLTDEQLEQRAMFLAMCVRNAIEDVHATGAISDLTMAEINPLIRNAIYTGLVAIDEFPMSRESVAFVQFTRALIPAYWEPPKILANSGLEDCTDAVDIGVYDIECPVCGAAPQEECCRGGNPKYPMDSPHGKRFNRVRAATYRFIESFDPL